MCGTKQSNSTAKATAAADRWTSPDVITLTDLIATLSNNGQQGDHAKVDEVFADAVKRGIFFSNMLDSTFEVDLSGMSFPVARAACRYALNRTLQSAGDGEKLRDMSIITGVGAAMNSKTSKENGQRGPSSSGHGRDSGADRPNGGRKALSLRDYIQEILREDFDPPIQSLVPKRAQGTVEIDKSILQEWIKRRNKQ